MSHEKFLEDFVSAVDFQNPVEITLNTVLDDLPEWDSLAALAIIVMFDLEYEKTITGEHLDKTITLGDLYALTGL